MGTLVSRLEQSGRMGCSQTTFGGTFRLLEMAQMALARPVSYPDSEPTRNGSRGKLSLVAWNVCK